MPTELDPDVRRFMRHVRVGSTVDECWIWLGATNQYGYGRFRVGGRRGTTEQPHRWTYQRVNGRLPRRVQVDHIHPECPKICCNPAHLRRATHKQNQENRSGPNAGTRSGVRGVAWHETTGKWTAQVQHNGFKHYLGLFPTVIEAEGAVVEKRKELFTHNTIDRRV